MYVTKVEKPGQKRKGDVIHSKEASSTWRDHMQLNHPEHVMTVSLVGGGIKICYVDFYHSQHHGFPEGCKDCRARGIVKDKDGRKICLHSTVLKEMPGRDDDITDADLDNMPDLIDFM